MFMIDMRVCLVTVEEPSSPSDGSDNEVESDEGSDRLATSSAANHVCIYCKTTSKIMLILSLLCTLSCKFSLYLFLPTICSILTKYYAVYYLLHALKNKPV